MASKLINLAQIKDGVSMKASVDQLIAGQTTEGSVDNKIAVAVGNLGNKKPATEETEAVPYASVKDYVDTQVSKVEAGTTADMKYTNEAGTTVALGGIAKGTTFDNMDIKDIIENMLYPYVAITAGSLSITATKTLEVGDSVTFDSGTVTYTKGSKNCTKLEILNSSNTVLGTLEDTNVASGSTVTLDATETVSVPTTTGSSASVTYKGRVTDAQGTAKTTGNVTFNFYRPYYVGTMDVVPSVESEIKALTKNVAARPATLTAENLANKYWVVAYPATYSDIKATKGVLDANGFDVTGNITKTTMNITCLDGEVKSYKVYYGLQGTADANFTVAFA